MGKLTGAGMSPHQIYEYLTNGPGTGMLDEAHAATRVLWAKEEERADLIRKQAELIRGGWQGSASEGAFGAAQPLAASALSGADQLSLAEDLLDRQSGSFHRAANSVRPVPPAAPQMDILDTMLPFADFEKEVKAYQSDAHHNIEVFRGYDNASEYNQTNIPAQYSTISHSGGNISVTTDDARRGSTGDFIDVADYEQPRGGNESGVRGDPGGRPAGGSPIGEPASGPPVNGPEDAQPPRQTTPSDFAPPSVNTPGFPSPQPTGPTPGGSVAGLPVGGFPSSGTREPGARGGSGGPGPGGRGGPSPGPGARGAVPGVGPGVGVIAAEEAAARRAAAAAAARSGGPGVMGGAPVAGRGKGDEDEEHQRKILIEIDPESTFGSEVLTAPQVIGDDEYEDD